MTSAEICALSQSSLNQVRALKQDFDAVFEVLTITGSSDDLQKVIGLQKRIEQELRTPLIARSQETLSERTLVYMSELQPGIFKHLPKSLECLYTSFPEGKLQIERLQIGGKTIQEFQELMREKNIWLSNGFSLEGPDFILPQQPEPVELLKIRVGDLGLQRNPTIEDVYERIYELGLELCPLAVGFHYRLAHLDQEADDWVHVGMEPITNKTGDPIILAVGRESEILWLDGLSTGFVNANCQFLFRVRRDT